MYLWWNVLWVQQQEHYLNSSNQEVDPTACTDPNDSGQAQLTKNI